MSLNNHQWHLSETKFFFGFSTIDNTRYWESVWSCPCGAVMKVKTILDNQTDLVTSVSKVFYEIENVCRIGFRV